MTTIPVVEAMQERIEAALEKDGLTVNRRHPEQYDSNMAGLDVAGLEPGDQSLIFHVMIIAEDLG